MPRAARNDIESRSSERFEPVSAQGAATLALWPPNADRVVALTDLCRASLDMPASLPRARDWRHWIGAPDSESIRTIVPAGRYDAPPIVQSAIRGDRFALIAGFLTDPDLHLRLWTDALAETHGEQAAAHALALLRDTCALSDVVVERSGITEDARWPDHHLEGEVGVPDDETFDRIADALVLVPGQFDGSAVPPRDLGPLFRRAARPPGEAWRHPLVRRDDGTILLAAPADLLRAALVHAAELVGGSPRTAAAVTAQLYSGALNTLRGIAADMDCTVESASATGILIRFDIDKLLAVEVVIPSLERNAATAEMRDLAPELDAPLERLAHARSSDPDIVLGILAHLGDGRITACALHDPEPPFGPWPANLADLRLIGDALRRDPLGLWRQLEHAPPPPWPGGAKFTDIVGLHRRWEDYPVPGYDDDHVSRDGTEYLHQRARVMAGRHPAPAPPHGRMTTVSRWGGTADSHVFAPEDSSRDGSLVARGAGRFVWVNPARRPVEPNSLEQTLVHMTAFWAARLLERGWLWFPDADEVAIDVVVDFHDAPGPELALTPARGGLRLVAGPAFVHTLCRGDNVGDRMLLQALVRWWLPIADAPARLADNVAPPGHGTFTVWPQPYVRARDPGPEPPPLVPAGVRRRVEAEIATHVVEPHQLAVIQDEDVLPHLDNLIRILLATIERSIDELAPEALVEAVRLHERALAQEEREGITLPARAAIPKADQLLGAREASPVRGIALRAIVDRLAARTPHGHAPPSLERINALRARMEALAEWGSARDAARAGLADLRVLLMPMIGIRVDAEGRGPRAMTAMSAQHADAAPARMLAEHHDWWTEDPVLEPALHLDRTIELEDRHWRAVDAAMLDAWGYGWEELLRILRALSNRALNEPGATATAAPEQLAADLAADTKIIPERIERVLPDLRLTADPSYDPRERQHKPWGVNRHRSYIRRPLVELPDGRLAWSAEHVLRTARHLNSLCLQNRLRATGALKRAVGRLSQSADGAFEAEVARRARDAGWQTLEGRKTLGGRRLERARGQDIGNLDVLAFRPETGHVLLLEAKRLFPALMPFGMEAEAAKLTGYAAKHEERVAWVRAHTGRLEREIGRPAYADAWVILGALVVDQPLVGAHLIAGELPIWTIDELGARLA